MAEAPHSSEGEAPVRDRRRRLLITFAVMAATIMQTLDLTIVNVALPDIKGQLAATPEQISWVLTSYIVASGIFMPLTGYLTDRLGQKRYLVGCIAGFTAASTLCGLSTSLTELVLFRILQGVFGAAVVPLAQAIMVQTFPLRERGRALAIWSMGVTLGPVLGPTLGGWLTETLSWHWTFLINVPVGILAAVVAWRVIPDTPKRARRMDWSGFALLIMAVGGLQLMLDRGTAEGWFSSNEIRGFALISAVGFIGFMWHSLSPGESPLFDLRIFRDRNFTAGCTLLTVMSMGLFGTMIILPLMLEGLMGYPTTTIGLLMAPRGLASIVAMQVMGRMVDRTDPRKLIAVGLLIFTAGSYMTTLYNLDMSPGWILMPAILQGLGMGLILVPLSVVSYSTLPSRFVAEAAGVYSLVRTLGSAVGISVISMLVSRQLQMAWNQLGGGIRATSPAVSEYLGAFGLSTEAPQAGPLLAMELARQSQMVAYVDAFIFITASIAVTLPVLLLIKRQPRRSEEDAVRDAECETRDAEGRVKDVQNADAIDTAAA